ncbi:hypothetical protein evm_014572 [Chilo suppressalis]|nr:hypothetical protein evm_014572 [Chilo suppressalis]
MGWPCRGRVLRNASLSCRSYSTNSCTYHYACITTSPCSLWCLRGSRNSALATVPNGPYCRLRPAGYKMRLLASTQPITLYTLVKDTSYVTITWSWLWGWKTIMIRLVVLPAVQDEVAGFDPTNNTVYTGQGHVIHYDYMVVAMGMENNYDKIRGLQEALKHPSSGVTTIYGAEFCRKTRDCLRQFRGGHALFTFPSSGSKCSGAAQKIMYLADDHWRQIHEKPRTYKGGYQLADYMAPHDKKSRSHVTVKGEGKEENRENMGL